MKIYDVFVNQIEKPIGYDLSGLRITFKVKDADPNLKTTKGLKIWTESEDSPIFLIANEKYEDNTFEPKISLAPRTRYNFEITISNGNTQAKATSFFETGKMNEPFLGKWIENPNRDIANTLFKTVIYGSDKLVNARLYATALGVYEVYLDGQKLSNEILAPGFTNYDYCIQLQTYDLTVALSNNKKHDLVFSLGDGWYKGKIGFKNTPNVYGDHQRLIGEIHLKYNDGTEKVIGTDGKWLTTSGKITKSGIYYGEDLDDTQEIINWVASETVDQTTKNLKDRLSVPLTVKEELPVKQIIHTPKGETVLDFGQNHAGWPIFNSNLKTGQKVLLEVGEILQDGNFYNKNLRQARASFSYISDGVKKWIHPHFTYYGYRYVRITGFTKVDINNFKSQVIYSDLKQTGYIKTNNKLVNRLFQNVLWGQKSNFFDIPTDCPQRDERLGWTGDAEIFAETASFNMNVFPFYKKYARDMMLEQKASNGLLPVVIPSIKMNDMSFAIWGDAATIIPWITYLYFGDKSIISQNYPYMKAWVDWIARQTQKKDLWVGGMQLGDWLSLDNPDPHERRGITDPDFIASIYYAYSAEIVSKSAALLGKDDESTLYQNLSCRIRDNINAEYVTPNGRVVIDTQTANVLALHFDILTANQKQHVIRDLVKRIKKDNYHLTTGFVGTPYLCEVLSENGYHDLAVKIFLQEDYPSWLYAVKQGATTIWERWNSVLPNGKMNPEGMNSLNHYSLGAVMAWAYKYILGIRSHSAGFKHVEFSPQFDKRLSNIEGSYESLYGQLKIKYSLRSEHDDKCANIMLDIPFGMDVTVKLPKSTNEKILVNNKQLDDGSSFDLKSGIYKINYLLRREQANGKENFN